LDRNSLIITIKINHSNLFLINLFFIINSLKVHLINNTKSKKYQNKSPSNFLYPKNSIINLIYPYTNSLKRAQEKASTLYHLN
jgi:hypothetical protein